MTAVKENPIKRRRGNPNWVKGGPSGNPSGRPKTHEELRQLIKHLYPEAVKRLGELAKSDNEAIAHKACETIVVYSIGKPQEGTDVHHQDAMTARRAQLVGVVSVTKQESPSLPPVTAPGVEAGVKPSLTSVVSSPLAPLEATGVAPVASVPSVLTVEALAAPRNDENTQERPAGLRCLFRSSTGQCGDLAVDGKQWCQRHIAELFAKVNA